MLNNIKYEIFLQKYLVISKIICNFASQMRDKAFVYV